MRAKNAAEMTDRARIDRRAAQSAIRQYRASARKHHRAGVDLLVAGMDDWASQCFEFSRRLGIAAIAEKITEPTK